MKKKTTAGPDGTAATGTTAKGPAEPIAPLAIGMGGVAVLLIAILAYPRHSSAPGINEDAAMPQPTTVVASAAVATHANAPAKKTSAPRPEKNHFADTTKSGRPIAAVMPAADVSSRENAAVKSAASDPSVRTAAAVVPTGSAGIAPITLTGCLEMSVDHDEFRLTDTDGADAPKSRSWKSGFLKKHSAAVALLEPPARLALETHVGRRVTATGLLSGHDMKVSALRAVGPPCD